MRLAPLQPGKGWRHLIAGMAFSIIAVAVFAQTTSYRVQQTWKLGGDGGWDYLVVDSPEHLLYIARANRVMVVDLTSGKQAGEIPGLLGIHGIAFDTQGKYGYISDGAATKVRVFDRTTRKLVTSVATGLNPDAILFEPVTQSVFTFNGRSKNSTVIDAKKNRVIDTIALPGKPEFAVTDGQGTIFVNIEDTNQLLRIDARARKVTAEWKLNDCESPTGLAFDVGHKRLFSVCGNQKMIVTDADTGSSIATPAIGNGPDAAAFDASHNLAFSSNGDGTLTIVDADPTRKYDVLQTVSTQKSARTMALDPATGLLYLVAAQMGPRPPATPENQKPRPRILPGSFSVLVVGP